MVEMQLTPQQLQALDAEGDAIPRVVDPRTNRAYRLIPESEFDSVREMLDEESLRLKIQETALRNAVGRTDKR